MNKPILIAGAVLASLAAGAQAYAAPANAVGTVNVTGSVQAQCSSTSFSDTIALGELSNASTGALDTSLPNNTGLTKDFKVVCSSVTPTVVVSATRLQNGTAGASAGYTDVVDYTATATADLSAGGSTPVAYTTAASPPAPTSQALSDRLANPATAANLHVTLSNAHTVDPTAILTAGSYSGTITVTVQPT